MEDILMRLQTALKWAIPCRCMLCHSPGPELICTTCIDKFNTPNAVCSVCGVDLPYITHTRTPVNNVCGQCLSNKPPFHSCVFPFYYSQPLLKLIIKLKFGDDLLLTKWFATMIVTSLEANHSATTPDCLVPIPLHSAHTRERGYNQSYLIAKQLSRQLNIPVYKRALQRTKATPMQSGLNRIQRTHNLKGAFLLDKAQFSESLRGQHIGLVDDVITTASTMHAAALSLRTIKPSKITLLAIAKTPYHQNNI